MISKKSRVCACAWALLVLLGGCGDPKPSVNTLRVGFVPAEGTDFTAVESTSETFSAEPAVVVSESLREEQSSAGTIGGVPGALTNQPPGSGRVATQPGGGPAAALDENGADRERKGVLVEGLRDDVPGERRAEHGAEDAETCRAASQMAADETVGGGEAHERSQERGQAAHPVREGVDAERLSPQEAEGTNRLLGAEADEV